ncbi:MAG TPA: hypothetical protein VLE96_04815 [Chlamydiales bacterium]|nr:hypothetical protein [Chlamydiales bacterium]
MNNPFIDRKQNFFQLACIQVIPLGITAMSIGDMIAKKHGAGVAIGSIIVANLILWLIAILIITMAFRFRSNAVENVNNYLGKFSSWCMRFLLMISFLFWYTFQIRATLPILEIYLNKSSLLYLGTSLALFSAILSMGGIRLIKWSTVISFPFVLGYILYGILQTGPTFSEIGYLGISASAVLASVLSFFPFTANTTTFFRHSRSRADSYLALTLTTVINILFQASTIWIKFTQTENYFFTLVTLFFIMWILICVNLLSFIYLVSASWEGWIRQLNGAKGYLFIGIIGTLAHILLPDSAPFLLIQNLANCYLASQAAILCIGFLIHFLIEDRPHYKGKNINSFCWLMGCIVATILTIHNSADTTTPLFAGIWTSIASFFGVLFIKENVWAAKTFLKL